MNMRNFPCTGISIHLFIYLSFACVAVQYSSCIPWHQRSASLRECLLVWSDPDFFATAKGMENEDDLEGNSSLQFLPHEALCGMTIGLQAWPRLELKGGLYDLSEVIFYLEEVQQPGSDVLTLNQMVTSALLSSHSHLFGEKPTTL